MDVTSKSDEIRCTQCGHVYEYVAPPPNAATAQGCPDCGGLSWIAAFIPLSSATPAWPLRH